MSDSKYIKLESQFGSVSIDLAVGNLHGLTLTHDGIAIQPLHTAHWIEDEQVQAAENLDLVEKRLSGDFFCAPFALNDVEPGPAHGWTANSHWNPIKSDLNSVELRLERRIFGASVTKLICLSNNSPMVYQTHIIEGGSGRLTCAHHPMVKLAGKGRFFTSPKQVAVTPNAPLDQGRNLLACPASHSDLTSFPAQDGGTVDLTNLPIGSGYEDFVTLVEAKGSELGWSAVMREEEGDIVFILKNPKILPVTMLWHSNGGRDYWPWNSKHTGVLGIEDGCAAGSEGHKASISENAISKFGVSTSFSLAENKIHRIIHAIGAFKIPNEWDEIKDMQIEQGQLKVTGNNQNSIQFPLAQEFLKGFGNNGDS